ncbi:hypothetical protein [Phaeodactylibacter xiamenensis]|uniref:hypothetical protein n=1 Tax=Phaeodactylibacter xiamenensis TaxID=1524460 RepID=UPI003BA91B7D
MKTPVSQNLNRILISAFSIFWVLLVLIAYFGFHPYYFTSLLMMPNADLFAANTIIAAGAWAWWVFSGKSGRTRKVNGLQVYGLFLLFQVVTMLVFNNRYSIFDTPAGLWRFLGINVLVHGGLFLLYTLAYVAGQPGVSFLSNRLSKGTTSLLRVAIGTSFIGIVVFLLGAVHQLTTMVAGIMALGVLGWRYREVWSLWQGTLLKRQAYKYKNRWMQLPIFFLLSTLAVNGIGAVKPFPTGFDGAALYMNTTQLIINYKGLIEGGQAYYWQLILSLGELLFGKAVFSIGIAHFSFLLVLLAAFRLARLLLSRSWSWAAVGLLALNPSLSFHYLYDEKVDLGFTFITLAAVLMLIEFWTGTAKPDTTDGPPAKLPFGLSATQWMLLLTGWLLGFAFGIKYTGLLGIVAIFTVIGYRFGNYWLAMSLVTGFSGVLFLFGGNNFGYFPFGNTAPYVVGLIGIGAAVALLVPAWMRGIDLKSLLMAYLLSGGAALLCFAPWGIRNLAANGEVGVQALLEAPFPTPVIRTQAQAPEVDYPARLMENIKKRTVELDIPLSAAQLEQISNYLEQEDITAPDKLNRGKLLRFITDQVLSPEQQEKAIAFKFREDGIDNVKSVVVETNEETTDDLLFSAGALAKREEIQRYLGYESGLPLYASLPYDLTINTNILKSQYIDIGILFLVLFPILLFSEGKNKLIPNLALFVLSIFLFLLGVWTVDHQEGLAVVQEQLLRSAPPAYESFVNGIWDPFNNTLLLAARPLASLFEAASDMAFSGVFAILLLLGGLTGWLLKIRWEGSAEKVRYLLLFTIAFGGLWLLIGSGITWYGFPMLVTLMIFLVYGAQSTGFEYRNVRSWAVGATLAAYILMSYALVFISALQPPKNAGLIYQEPVLRSFGEGLNATETLSSFKPYLGEAIDYINQNEEDKVYRVGTFFNYHINFNDRRVLEDNQLGKYDEIMRALDGEEDAFIDVLKAERFRYILFDMNTASLDRTPEKSLTEKTRRFSQMLFTSPKVRLIFTDNVVKGEPGETVPLGKHRIPGRAGIRGETVYRGSYLLFEIN